MFKKMIALAATALALFATPAMARMERVEVHGTSLEGNWEGNSPDRMVSIWLPPSYDEDAAKRYPVIYFLHGFFLTDEGYTDFVNYDEAMAEAAAAGNEVILVMHDSLTAKKGSMYSASPATGDFEAFVAKDLVAYIDHNYRTIAERESRGLAGHSMGGYGTLRIGMKYPQVFSSIYAISSCCLAPSLMTPDNLERLGAMTAEEIASAGFGDAATLASLAAWAPDPEGPHFFEKELADGKVPPLTLARFAAGSPIVALPQYVDGLKTMEAIGIEIGVNDMGLIEGNRLMHEELTRMGVPHSYQEHDGDHVNRLKERTRTHMLPFFAEHLDRDGE